MRDTFDVQLLETKRGISHHLSFAHAPSSTASRVLRGELLTARRLFQWFCLAVLAE